MSTRLLKYKQDGERRFRLPCVFQARKHSGKDSYTLIFDSQVVEKQWGVVRHHLLSVLLSQPKIEFPLSPFEYQDHLFKLVRVNQLGTDKKINSKIQPLYIITLLSNSQYVVYQKQSNQINSIMRHFPPRHDI